MKAARTRYPDAYYIERAREAFAFIERLDGLKTKVPPEAIWFAARHMRDVPHFKDAAGAVACVKATLSSLEDGVLEKILRLGLVTKEQRRLMGRGELPRKLAEVIDLQRERERRTLRFSKQG